MTDRLADETNARAFPRARVRLIVRKQLANAGALFDGATIVANGELFETGEWWEDEWQGMPEFVQEDRQPWKTLLVHFEGPSALEDFSQLVGQKLGRKSQSIWFPENEIETYIDKRYADEAQR